MIYPNPSNTDPRFSPLRMKKGMMIVDILIALSLGALLITILNYSSFESREIFDRAKVRNNLLNIFMNHKNELYGKVYETKKVDVLQADNSTVRAISKTSWFGNELTQVDFTVGQEGAIDATSSSRLDKIYQQKIYFTAIASSSASQKDEVTGRALCSVDFGFNQPIGAYASLYGTSTNSSDFYIKTNKIKAPSIREINLPIPANLPLTDIEVRGSTAYITSDSNISTDPDLFVVDISNSNAVLLSSINTGPGLVAITLNGNRIFAAANSSEAQLHIIRQLLPTFLVLEKKYKLPLPYATATAAFASSIFYKDKTIYLGTEKWAGNEFNIVDVNNSANPSVIGSFETSSKISDIFVRGNAGYVAASDEKQLRILDLRDPANPAIANFFSPTGWQRQEGKSISFFEDKLSFGRTSGGFDLPQFHELFVWATTSSTTLMNPSSINLPYGVYGMLNDRSSMYLITRDTSSGFIILNTGENTSTPIPLTGIPISELPQNMSCYLNKIYILPINNPTLYEITFS